MGNLVPIALSRRSYRGRYRFESAARLINAYVESHGEEAKSQFALYAVNGWEAYATLIGASGGVRAMLAVGDELLVVAGRQLFCVKPDQSAVLVGGITSDGLVTMARNQLANPQTVIVADGQWYIYQAGFVAIGSDSDLPAPIYVVEKDNFFVFLSRDGRITLSGINSIAIDGLDFASAEARADGGVALATRGNDLVVFGEQSTEFWVNVGNRDFPFERQAFRNFGCYAAGSVSEITALVQGQMVDSVVWAATDEKGAFTGIFLLNGYSAQKISTTDIDRDILEDPAPQNIRSFSWSEDGHVFYTIKGTGFSYTYDTVEGVWHERRSKSHTHWRAVAHATFDRLTLFGDGETGTLYRSGRDLYDADGDDVVMEVHLPIVHAFPYELTINRFVLDAVPGVGHTEADAHTHDPQVVLDVSRDGGANFGAERARGLGRQGQTLKQIAWNGIGDVPRQGMVLRLRISAGVKRALLGAAIDVERLAA